MFLISPGVFWSLLEKEKIMPNKQIEGLSISLDLYDFMTMEVLAGTGVGSHQFWTGFAQIVEDLAPRLQNLLHCRAGLQAKIDDYHRSHAGGPFDVAAYEAFLTSIGYLVEAPAPFTIAPENLDDGLKIGAPQFVVPCSSPRALTRAINARWASLYDALYASDVIAEDKGFERGAAYNKERGALVIAQGRQFLDRVIPLTEGSHSAVVSYGIERADFIAMLEGGGRATLKDPAQFAAYQGSSIGPTSILLRHKGLFVELKFDKRDPVGRDDRTGLADIVLESAVTTITDFQDTVVSVDAADKINLYRNWLGVVKGSLRTQFKKNGRLTDRLFSADYRYKVPGQNSIGVAGRSLAMVRVNGPERLSDLIHDANGQPVAEMLLDVAVAALVGLHDTRRSKPPRNSDAGSIYLIVPQLQGPEETAFANDLFTRVEDLLNLPQYVVKCGLTNDTLRTSLNLAASIQPLAERIAWLGMSDFERARDQIATDYESGPAKIADEPSQLAWLQAYRADTIETALACGFGGAAQIAGSPWTRAENLKALCEKADEALSLGLNAAEVASPRAATLLAMHYHLIDVPQVPQCASAEAGKAHRLEQLAAAAPAPVSQDNLLQALDAHCHRILAYLVHCTDRGMAFWRIPDVHDVVRMEDRSAVRFSSTCVANWLHHKSITREQVNDALQRMAERVDQQNKHDAAYKPMTPHFDGSAFNAAVEILLNDAGEAKADPDAIIARRRIEAKAGQTPEVSNRFQFLAGATGRLESGEAFYGVSD
jgi:malate synthase